MTKAELIERYGIEWYEEYKARKNAECKERYKNDTEYRNRHIDNCKERQKERWKNDPEFREYHKEFQKCMIVNGLEYREYHREYKMKDINSNGKTKDSIRFQSRYILFKQRKHTKFKDYEIHHCFGYDNPTKFIYIPKSLHNKIHQYLRDNNIDADSNHYEYIKRMINECTEYTYISV